MDYWPTKRPFPSRTSIPRSSNSRQAVNLSFDAVSTGIAPAESGKILHFSTICRLLRPSDRQLPCPSCFLTSWKPLWLLSLPGRLKKSGPPRMRFSGTMSRSGTAKEPKLFTLHPIPVCLLFTLVALIPATLTLSQPQGQLCLLFSLSGPKKNCLYPFFEPRSTSLKKANSYMSENVRF